MSQDGFRTRFIRELDPDFSDIQKQIDKLPQEWNSFDINDLLNASRKHLHNVLAIRTNNKLRKEQNKPSPPDKENTSKPTEKKKTTKPQSDKPPTPESSGTNVFKRRSSQDIDIRAFIKKNKELLFRIQEDMIKGKYIPSKYEQEVKPGYCIWHNTKSHNHINCDHINALLHKYPDQPTSISVKELTAKHTSFPNNQQNDFEDIDLSHLQQVTNDLLAFNNQLNNINDNVTNYLTITCNLIKISDSPHLCHERTKRAKHNLQFVVDSGAYPHMTNEPKSFSSYTSWPTDHKIQNVLLANGITKARIKGIGSIKCWINNHEYTIRGYFMYQNYQVPFTP